MEYDLNSSNELKPLDVNSIIEMPLEYKDTIFYLNNLIFKLFTSFKSHAKANSIEFIPEFSQSENAIKDNLLEITTGLLRGIPMGRAQRSYIENISRLILILEFQNNLLNDPTSSRSSENNKKLESAFSGRKVYKLTKLFESIIKDKDVSYHQQILFMYDDLNNIVHSNYDEIKYESYIETFASSLKNKVDTSTHMQIKLLSMSLDLILGWTETILKEELLNRADIAIFIHCRDTSIEYITNSIRE